MASSVLPKETSRYQKVLAERRSWRCSCTDAELDTKGKPVLQPVKVKPREITIRETVIRD